MTLRFRGAVKSDSAYMEPVQNSTYMNSGTQQYEFQMKWAIDCILLSHTWMSSGGHPRRLEWGYRSRICEKYTRTATRR